METFLTVLGYIFLAMAAYSFLKSIYDGNIVQSIINGALLSLFTYLQFFYH